MAMKEPIIFATKNDQNKWQISKEARQVLESIDETVVVNAIVGNSRTGKSYLMNRLAGMDPESDAGFKVGSTVEAVTKGIWMWVVPHPTHTDKKLVLLDTEGLNDSQKENHKGEDLELFCLTISLCSSVIVNVQRNLDGDFIQTLHLVSELSNNITSGAGNSDKNLSEYFPQLVVLIRDFELKLEMDGKQLTPSDYLEKTLQANPQKSSDYNDPRDRVRQFFPDNKRRCNTLPLRSHDRFEDDLDCWRTELHATTQSMQFHGSLLTGRAYLDYADGLVLAINKSELHNIESALNSMARKDGERAVAAGFVEYQKACADIETRMPFEENDLDAHHIGCRENALDVFERTITLKKMQTYDGFLQEIQDKIEETYQDIAKRNLNVSEEACRSAIETCFSDLQSRIGKGEFSREGGHEKFKCIKEKAVDNFESQKELGPKKTNCLEAFLKKLEYVEKTIESADQNATRLSDEMNSMIKQKAHQMAKYEHARECIKVVGEMVQQGLGLGAVAGFAINGVATAAASNPSNSLRVLPMVNEYMSNTQVAPRVIPQFSPLLTSSPKFEAFPTWSFPWDYQTQSLRQKVMEELNKYSL